MITFRIDGHTIKRGALIGQLDHLVPLGVGIHAYAFRPSAQLVRSEYPLKNENANTLACDGETLRVLAHLQRW